MRALLNSAIIAAAAIAVPALAQDTSGTSFTGPRIEGHLGYDRLGTNNTTGHIDGLTYGAGAGYDFAFGAGGLRAGVEVNGDFSNTDGAATTGTSRFGVKAKRDLDASVRVGTVLGNRTLLYAKVGYANSRFRATLTDPTGTISASDNLDGVRAGAGIEYALSSRAYIKGEYRYTNYERGVDRNQAIGAIGFRF